MTRYKILSQKVILVTKSHIDSLSLKKYWHQRKTKASARGSNLYFFYTIKHNCKGVAIALYQLLN